VTRAGLQEAAPGQSVVDKNVGPEGSGSELKPQRAGFGPLKHVAKVLQKVSEPRFVNNHEEHLRVRFNLCQLEGSRGFAHRSMLDGKPSFRVAKWP